METEINEPKDLLSIIDRYIEKKINKAVDEYIEESIETSNEPDGDIIHECIVIALEKAKVPDSKWDAIFKYVEKEMHKEGFKFKLYIIIAYEDNRIH